MKDLERYLNEIVDPTIAELTQNRTSVRHTFLACVAVFHAIDYLAFPRRPRGIRQKFRKESKEFATVDDVAHAFKHVTTGQQRLRAAEVISRPPAVWGEMVWNLSRWDDAYGGVTLDRDRNVDLYDVIVRAVDFLRRQTKQG